MEGHRHESTRGACLALFFSALSAALLDGSFPLLASDGPPRHARPIDHDSLLLN